jgi:heavy metal sensor kinase
MIRVPTLRARIILWYGAIIAVCLLAYSIAVGLSFSTHVRRELDHRVHEDIELAARALVIDRDGNASWAGGFLNKQIAEEESGGHWVEVWDANRRLLIAGTFDPGLTHEPQIRSAYTREFPTGPVRVKTEAVTVEGRRFLVRAAVSEISARDQVRSLWMQLGGITLLVLVIGGIGGTALAHRLVGPLERMAAHARRITAEELHERLSVDQGGQELEQLGDAFNTTLARLEGSFAQLRRFTADASHEIRTPLTALRSVGEVALQGAKSGEEYREVIGTMLEEVDRLARLSDELLALARAEAGQVHYQFEPLDLATLAKDVAEQLEVLAEERGQSLVVDASEPVLVQADRITLRQALINLIDNAIKYSPEGAQVNVRVGDAFVEVEDNGPGIPPEHLEKIFDRFYRIDPSRSREMGGTGLGLSLVKLTTEAHGGHVEVESEPGRGTTFRLLLKKV